jgi:glycerol-3-phosphate cytidylyltransferase
MIVGYTTGTFDYLHEGHIRILRGMRKLCDRLIVGLTTDELAVKQKRATIMSFDHRRVLLESCKWVSHVVEHHGESKIVAYEKLRFHKLFIGDDYFGSREYLEVNEKYPEVEIVVIPRTSNVCTSQLWESLNKRVLHDMSIMHMGVGSSVIRRIGERLVTKTINLGYTEVYGERTANVYHFPIPVPRNWARVNTPAVHPNYPGVNGFREIDGGDMWHGKSWYPYDEHRVIYQSPQKWSCVYPLEEKKRPSMVVELIGRYGGDTLAHWVEFKYHRDEFRRLIKQVLRIIMEELAPQDFVHGDVHCRNVLVDGRGQVSLIDFGWCTHGSFVMQSDEREEHQSRVKDLFDVMHFRDSVEKLLVEELGLSSLWGVHATDFLTFSNVHNDDREPHAE